MLVTRTKPGARPSSNRTISNVVGILRVIVILIVILILIVIVMIISISIGHGNIATQLTGLILLNFSYNSNTTRLPRIWYHYHYLFNYRSNRIVHFVLLFLFISLSQCVVSKLKLCLHYS